MTAIDLTDLRLVFHRQGEGAPLVLLHGWPEWSRIWQRMLPGLAHHFDVVAPDLRNFGESIGAEARDVAHYVDDLEALVDHLGFERFGIVSHDVGAFVAQDFARRHPERLTGLFFFDCPHFGLGRRWLEGGQLREIWYQSFHQLPLAPALVGHSGETCRLYLRHFLSHWAHDPHAFDAQLDEWVEMFIRPGRLEGGFRWYAVANARRLAAMQAAGAEALEPIDVRAFALWGAEDPILRAAWADTLSDVFREVAWELVPDAGHFVHWERPELAVERVVAFFRPR